MIGTAVPEASVHKHCHTRRTEDDVGLTSNADDWPSMDSVTQSCCVERPSQAELNLGVPRLLSTHSPADASCRLKSLHSSILSNMWSPKASSHRELACSLIDSGRFPSVIDGHD
jgi:anti-sigma factor RsiW